MAPRKRGLPESGPHATYTFGDLLELTRAKRTNLIHWSSVRLIRPDIDDATGTGHHKRYSALNAVEVELAVTLNMLKLPTATIAVALDRFRLFHQECVALWTVGPLDGDVWNDEQRAAVEQAFVRESGRRDRRLGEETAPGRRVRAKRKRVFTDEEQRHALRLAAQWRQFLEGFAWQGFEQGRGRGEWSAFYLVVDPAQDAAHVVPKASVVESMGWGDEHAGNLTDAFIVVNLTAVMGFLRSGIALLDRVDMKTWQPGQGIRLV